MPAGPSAHRLSDIAQRFDLTLRGEDADVDGVGTLRGAAGGQISFLANPGYRPDLPGTRAAAVILREDDAADCPTRCLIAADPYLAFARVAALFAPARDVPPGIHADATVDPTAKIGADVRIGPRAVIGAGCRIGAGSAIGAGTVIEANSTLGRDCRLYANVTIGHEVRLGDRVIIHPGVVIGADGFGIALADGSWEKVPQLGGVVIGDDCEIGANTTIDRGAVDDTVLEEDVRVDNLVQIAHNVRIGAHTAIAAMTGIAGSARIGRYCLLAGGSGVLGHVEIADRVTVGARSSVLEPITETGATWSAIIPAQPLRKWQRNVALLRRLEDIWRRVRRLEKNLKTEGSEPV
ncbi:UDP-3-O-(3-hydroxymyristoyl)glucosamine N-acyltransferase [Elongatibacter sediminis]|uniref:UDP-3-O-acylglucosamine N-acyltransferase n=1 Tax=Elongatibacter sediminis TaxID=3119006 RepID=A0AAW9R8A5_9GAMM